MSRRGDTHRVMRWLWTSRRPDARLARLALLLNDVPSAATIAKATIPKWQYFSEHAEPSQAYLVSEILMALDALLNAGPTGH